MDIMLRSPEIQQAVERVVKEVSACIKRGNKILIAGNGGSAADSQHFAAELVSRYLKERRPISAIALSTDTSVITAIANDYGYERVFDRQIRGLGAIGDIFIAFSTSGSSENITLGLEAAKEEGLMTVAFTGRNGITEGVECDIVVSVPSGSVPRIQEVHGILIHCVCSALEEELF